MGYDYEDELEGRGGGESRFPRPEGRSRREADGDPNLGQAGRQARPGQTLGGQRPQGGALQGQPQRRPVSSQNGAGRNVGSPNGAGQGTARPAGGPYDPGQKSARQIAGAGRPSDPGQRAAAGNGTAASGNGQRAAGDARPAGSAGQRPNGTAQRAAEKGPSVRSVRSAGGGAASSRRQTKTLAGQSGESGRPVRAWQTPVSEDPKTGYGSRRAGGGRVTATSQAAEKAAQSAKKKKRRRVITLVIAELLALVFIFTYAYFVRTWNLMQKPDDWDPKEVANPEFSVDMPEYMKGHWTFAVFGVDSRDKNVLKGTNSDVIIICDLNRDTGEVRMVSLFRDTYLNIDDNGKYAKINQAYFEGGPTQAIKALNKNLDLNITDYVTFNWSAVANGINVLGGVDMNLSKAEFYYINSFITETVKGTGIGSHQLTHAGENHLDGVQAVAYGRLRLMDTDYARTERQRKVIQAAFDKAIKADWETLNSLVGAVLPHVSTSIDAADIFGLLRNITNFHIGETTGFPMARGEANLGSKGACVIPATLTSNVKLLHEFLYDETDYEPSKTVQNISSKIASDTGIYKEGQTAGHVSTDNGVIPTTKAPTTEAAEEKETTKALEEGEDGFFYDEDGNRYNEDGELVDEDGNRVDEDGNRIDEDGNPISEERHPKFTVDEDGNLIDEDGNLYEGPYESDEDGNFIIDGELYDGEGNYIGDLRPGTIYPGSGRPGENGRPTTTVPADEGDGANASRPSAERPSRPGRPTAEDPDGPGDGTARPTRPSQTYPGSGPGETTEAVGPGTGLDEPGSGNNGPGIVDNAGNGTSSPSGGPGVSGGPGSISTTEAAGPGTVPTIAPIETSGSTGGPGMLEPGM